MNVIGDLERLFATSLYPLRVPIAVALILATIGLAFVARRRGWLAVARRHPLRASALTAAILVVAVPVGWYLGSPLFIRTTLVEPGPAAVNAPTTPSSPPVAAPDQTDAPAASTAVPPLESAPASTPFAPITVVTGPFEGADEFHFGEGTASIVETAPGTFVLRFESFSVRNGPDLYVYLSPDRAGYADGALELGTLKATDGAFGYALPDGFDPTDFESAVIWCKQFAVQFAVAPLEAV